MKLAAALVCIEVNTYARQARGNWDSHAGWMAVLLAVAHNEGML